MLKVMSRVVGESLRYRWDRTPWMQKRYRRAAERYASGFHENGKPAEIVLRPRHDDALPFLPVGERCYEYAYAVQKLRERSITDKDVFDVGSATSVLPGIVASLGNRVCCIDIRRWEMVWPGLSSVDGGIFGARLPNESFDAATCISTIEHVGLGRFGDEPDPEGDLRCMERMRELLRPGGWLILTMPYGRPTVVFPRHRIYGRVRLERLTEGFEIIEQSYFAPLRAPRFWEPCSEDDTAKIDPKITHATTCCLLRRH